MWIESQIKILFFEYQIFAGSACDRTFDFKRFIANDQKKATDKVVTDLF